VKTLHLSKDLRLPPDAVLAAEPRLWAGVDKNGPIAPGMATPCWVWKGYTRNGYGSFSICDRQVYLHRLAFFFQHGRWPSEQVCHRCDVKRCVRGDHLVDAPQAFNVEDMWAKGRAKKPPRLVGMANHKAHLTDEQVLELRALRGTGVQQREVARRFGVSQSTVWRIFHGTTRAA
jgi:HNH endonuclease/Helix-turn-helix domain of resolvase